jgi:Superfamily II helicase
MPTGRGKTLVGLLMLQSILNDNKGPALYLCPNNYLVNQTIKIAESFGIKTTKFDEDRRSPIIPIEFINSETILVTNCHKVFNGKSKFGVEGYSREFQQVGAIVIDDAHKCQEIIREQFSIIVESNYGLYKELLSLFEEVLKKQEIGTYNDIKRGINEAFLAVPYWSWMDNISTVNDIISKYVDLARKESNRKGDELNVFLTWDLIKNDLLYCTCIFSGKKMEIVPRLVPLDRIPSFKESSNRLYLSATLSDDVFLVKDFNISPNIVAEPLTCNEKKYSGERLIILPSLVDNNLDRETIIDWLSRYVSSGKDFGVFALVNSKYRAKDWNSPDVTTVKNLDEKISKLLNEIENNEVKSINVLINGYDGVDLPDKMCRILCMDSLPSYTTLYEQYVEKNLRKTSIYRKLISQRIEQGLGRSIRGTNDWSVAILIGNDLTSFISDKSKRIYLSDQIQKQLNISELILPDLKKEHSPINAIEILIQQCINRDDGWRRFYKKNMVDVKQVPVNTTYLDRLVLEREAEIYFQNGQYTKATDTIQKVIDQYCEHSDEKGWYFQLKGLYLYKLDKSQSIDCQIKANQCNYNTFSRSNCGISYAKLLTRNFDRETAIHQWINNHDNYNTMIVDVEAILDNISFKIPHDLFEEGIKTIGEILGFGTQRPEKEFKKEGAPDNLWEISSQSYWIIECKNEVESDRGVSKEEMGQMMNSIGWFEDNYSEAKKAIYVIIHPSDYKESEVHPLERVKILTPSNLIKLKNNIKYFFISFKDIPFTKINNELIREKLHYYHLIHTQLEGEYLVVCRDKPR